MQTSAQALSLFDQLGAPERELARRVLACLQEKMGDEEFQAALQEAPNTAPPSPADVTS